MSSHESVNDKLVYMKPLDHEEFCTALGRAKTVTAFPVQECPPSSGSMVSCSMLFPGNGREEPIRSANPIPRLKKIEK